MKIPFYVSLVASSLCLVLSVILLFLGSSNTGLQAEMQKQQQALQIQQEQINAGNTISQQVGPNLIRDMAMASIKNEQMKAVLGRHGYNISYNPPATPAPGTIPPVTTPALPSGIPILRP